VLLAHWVNAHTGTDDPAAINSALQAALAAIDPQLVSAANAISMRPGLSGLARRPAAAVIAQASLKSAHPGVRG
jgi:hypothetical protein